MKHTEYFPDWKNEVRGIISWVHKNFANEKWGKYGVTVTNEQTVYQQPGNAILPGKLQMNCYILA